MSENIVINAPKKEKSPMKIFIQSAQAIAMMNKNLI